MLTRLIERAQQRREVKPGDPRNHAVSLISPMLVAVLFLLTCRQEGWLESADLVLLRIYQFLLWAMLLATIGSGLQYLVKAYRLMSIPPENAKT